MNVVLDEYTIQWNDGGELVMKQKTRINAVCNVYFVAFAYAPYKMSTRAILSPIQQCIMEQRVALFCKRYQRKAVVLSKPDRPALLLIVLHSQRDVRNIDTEMEEIGRTERIGTMFRPVHIASTCSWQACDISRRFLCSRSDLLALQAARREFSSTDAAIVEHTPRYTYNNRMNQEQFVEQALRLYEAGIVMTELTCKPQRVTITLESWYSIAKRGDTLRQSLEPQQAPIEQNTSDDPYTKGTT